MKFKKLFLILLASVAVSVLCSCSADSAVSEDTSSISIDKSQNYEYIIVYGHNASDSVVHQASLLCNTLKEQYGVEIYTKSDWEYRPNDSLEAHNHNKKIEILLGNTNREQSTDVYDSFTSQNEYVIKADKNAIIIAATSDNLLIQAIDHFRASFLSLHNENAVIPGNTEIHNCDFSFFDIAKNGLSSCTVVIPSDHSARIEDLALNIASKINSLCNTEIKVLSEDNVQSTDGCILIGKINDQDCISINQDLEPNQSIVKHVNSKVIIAGFNESSLINGIFSFMGNIVMKYDRRSDGTPYLYFPTDLELLDSWTHFIPNIPGSVLESTSQDSNFLFNINYNDVDKAEFSNYLELLKNLNFIVTGNKNSHGDIISVSATYNNVDAEVSIQGAVNMLYNKSDKTLGMTITYTLKYL